MSESMQTVSDIAQMRFRSVSSPDQYGIMAVSDDGTFRIVPSDEFRDEMARLEEVALLRSKTLGLGTGIVLLGIGAALVGFGWYWGRVLGKIGSTLSRPRSLDDVQITHLKGGGLRVMLRGWPNRLQTVQMAWNPDEVLQPEAEAFVAKLHELQATEPRKNKKTKNW
jgi:hypothetical protein